MFHVCKDYMCNKTRKYDYRKKGTYFLRFQACISSSFKGLSPQKVRHDEWPNPIWAFHWYNSCSINRGQDHWYGRCSNGSTSMNGWQLRKCVIRAPSHLSVQVQGWGGWAMAGRRRISTRTRAFRRTLWQRAGVDNSTAILKSYVPY